MDYAKANQRWWIQVRFNSQVDVAIFEKTIRGSAMRLAELKGSFFIEDPRLPDTATMAQAFAHAREELPRLNAAVKVLCPHYVPARFCTLVEVFPEGYGRSIASTSVAVPGSSDLKSVLEFLGGPDTDLPAIIGLFSQSTDLKEALYYFGAEGNPWSNLYKVCEIIEDACGSKEQVLSCAWCSRSDWERFKRTANHQEAIGTFSRHARTKVVPPPDPMPLNEARSLVGGILRRWIQELLRKRPIVSSA